jgi:hypothetical protein
VSGGAAYGQVGGARLGLTRPDHTNPHTGRRSGGFSGQSLLAGVFSLVYSQCQGSKGLL